MRLPANGGTPEPVTQLAPGQTSHRWPQFLPDGRRFLFFVQGSPATRGVYIGSLDGDVPRRVLAAETAAAYAAPGYLFLVSDGVLVVRRFDAARGVVGEEAIPVAQSVGTTLAVSKSAFSVSDAGVLAYRSGEATRRQLVWVDRAGRTLSAVRAPEEIGVSAPELAPDRRHAAVARNVQGNVDIWLIELAGGIANRFTFHTALDAATAIWSPDGSRIVFRSSRNDGRFDLFEKPANGATEEQPLLVTEQDKSATDWSSDGRFLLYTTSDPKTQSDLWALPLTGERKPFRVVQTTFDETEAQFSPDARWIAYTSNETGRYEVYVRPFLEPGGKRQVSTAGGIYPRWRPDGRELFYVTLDNEVMAVPIQLTAQTRALTPGAPIPLFRSRMAIGGNTGIGGYSSRAMYDVAPDSRFLMVVNTDDTAPPPITVVLNWTAALRH